MVSTVVTLLARLLVMSLVFGLQETGDGASAKYCSDECDAEVSFYSAKGEPVGITTSLQNHGLRKPTAIRGDCPVADFLDGATEASSDSSADGEMTSNALTDTETTCGEKRTPQEVVKPLKFPDFLVTKPVVFHSPPIPTRDEDEDQSEIQLEQLDACLMPRGRLSLDIMQDPEDVCPGVNPDASRKPDSSFRKLSYQLDQLVVGVLRKKWHAMVAHIAVNVRSRGRNNCQ